MWFLAYTFIKLKNCKSNMKKQHTMEPDILQDCKDCLLLEAMVEKLARKEKIHILANNGIKIGLAMEGAAFIGVVYDAPLFFLGSLVGGAIIGLTSSVVKRIVAYDNHVKEIYESAKIQRAVKNDEIDELPIGLQNKMYTNEFSLEKLYH